MKWILASFTIFILGLFNLFAPIRGGFHYVFNPIQFGIKEFALELADWSHFFANIQNIYIDNQKLITQKESLISQIESFKELESENVLLRQQLKLKEDFDFSNNLTLVRVIGSVDSKLGRFISLDKGSNHGISVNDIVLQEKYLIGIVREVTKNRSKVELVTSPDLSINVTDSRSGIEGISQGQYGTTISVNRILPSDSVLEGDVFVTNGKDGVFPPGFIVGSVDFVSGETPNILKSVSLVAMLDLGNLRKAFVLSSK
ncbi:rod shape-determining protein MreC [candidate division WWE3 bacterium]|nr:rod shape-determining protein MreC [candidate division WWE3 bacterium]